MRVRLTTDFSITALDTRRQKVIFANFWGKKYVIFGNVYSSKPSFKYEGKGNIKYNIVQNLNFRCY